MREVSPVVVAVLELLPGFLEFILPGPIPEEAPEGGGGDLDAVVEVGLPGEVGDAKEFVAEDLEFAAEVAEVLPLFVLGAGALAAFGGEAFEVAAGGGDLGFDKVGDCRVEGVAGEAVVVDPEGVGAGLGGEGPVDGGLAAALAVALEVVFEEFAAGFLLGEIITQGFYL